MLERVATTLPPAPPAPMTSQPRRDGRKMKFHGVRFGGGCQTPLPSSPGRTMLARFTGIDLRLLLLTITGYFPSHTLRNFVYRRVRRKAGLRSSIHWRASSFTHRGCPFDQHTTIGNDGFFGTRARA